MLRFTSVWLNRATSATVDHRLYSLRGEGNHEIIIPQKTSYIQEHVMFQYDMSSLVIRRQFFRMSSDGAIRKSR